MIPASFAPMLLRMFLGKKIFPKIAEAIAEHIAKMFKLPQMVDYMELPNDADRRIDKLEDQMSVLVDDSHPPVINQDEWEDVKATIKKIKNKKAFKSLNAK